MIRQSEATQFVSDHVGENQRRILRDGAKFLWAVSLAGVLGAIRDFLPTMQSPPIIRIASQFYRHPTTGLFLSMLRRTALLCLGLMPQAVSTLPQSRSTIGTGVNAWDRNPLSSYHAKVAKLEAEISLIVQLRSE